MIDRKPKKACRVCGEFGHYSFQCFKGKKAQIVTKRLHPGGKYFKQWQLTRKTWFRNNPPDHAGYYLCYLRISPRCFGAMKKVETTLDHIKSRSRYPELRFDQNNLAPCCPPCNELKGSRDLDDIV